MKTKTTISTTTELQDKVESLQCEVYDNLTLQRERLTQLSKLVNTAIADLHKHPEYPNFGIEQAGIVLGIAQFLIDDFQRDLDDDIQKSGAIAYPFLTGGAR